MPLLEKTTTFMTTDDYLDDPNAVLWEADPDTLQFTYVSQGAERLLGYPINDWLTRPSFWSDLVHPHDREHVIRTCQTAMSEGRDHECEYRMRAADGRVLWMRDIVRVESDADGLPVHLSGVMLDITSHKLSEAALERQDRYYRALIEHTTDIITVMDGHGIVQYESPSAERVLGYPFRDRIGRDVFDWIHPDDLPNARAMFKRGAQSGEPTQGRFRHRHVDGTWRTIEAVGRSFVDDDGRNVGIVNSRDITERTKLEEQFRHAQKMEALGRLTSSVAHDFNNVLVTILGNACLAAELRSIDDIKPKLAAIQAAVELGSTLTRQLLTFSRFRGSTCEIIDVNRAVLDLEGMIERLVGPGVDVQFALKAKPALVSLGRGQLEQTLMNLCTNARDAMPSGGVLRILTSNGGPRPASDPATDVFIEVVDNGVGMPQKIQSKIFEPYFTTKEPGKGTGLGLATVYGIINDAGGKIEVDSHVGHGSRFRIRLPLCGAGDGE